MKNNQNSILNFSSFTRKKGGLNNLIYRLYSKILQKWHIVSLGLQPRLAILICRILKNQPTKDTNWKITKSFL